MVRECGRDRSKVKPLLLQRCVLGTFHEIEGPSKPALSGYEWQKWSGWFLWFHSFLRFGKTSNKKHENCLATLLENELYSDVARFTTNIKPVLQQKRRWWNAQHRNWTRFSAMLQKRLHVIGCSFFRTFSGNPLELARVVVGPVHTNPGGKICGFKTNVRIRVNGAWISATCAIKVMLHVTIRNDDS